MILPQSKHLMIENFGLNYYNSWHCTIKFDNNIFGLGSGNAQIFSPFFMLMYNSQK